MSLTDIEKKLANEKPQKSRTAKNKGTKSLTTDELFEEFKTQQKAVRLNRELKKQNNAERAIRITLNPLGEEFPFQCSCGAKHLFWYIENKKGVRFLTLNQVYNKGN